MRELSEVDKEIDAMIAVLEGLQTQLSILLLERDCIVKVHKGREASAEILAEKAIEKAKNDL